jgi:hypothetical protein
MRACKRVWVDGWYIATRAMSLPGSHPLLERGLRRIHDARVDVAELFECEEIGGVFRRIELIGRRLVDRHGRGSSQVLGPYADANPGRVKIRRGFTLR